ncbi:MAG: protein jag [Chloroflexi bacterium]|nr:protein jag [Chloroflexota bacterium]
MVESVEATGRSVDEAIENALDELGLERDEVTVEVLGQGGAGRPAHVRVTPLEGIELEDDEEYDEDEELEDELDEDEEYDDEAEEEAGDEGTERSARIVAADVTSAPPEVRAAADIAADVLVEVLDLMELPSDVQIDSVTDDDGLPSIELSIHGQYGGILIGRHGETLAALQFLLGLMTGKRAGRRVRVLIDVEGYRERRARLLRDIALRAAERAQRYRQPIFLDPMLPAERRIVHLALADHPGVSTHSVGEGDSRRVVISPRQAQRFGGYGAR